MTSEAEALWTQFKNDHPSVSDDRLYEVFCFGDSEALANELGGLVVSGVKRATAGSVWTLEAEGRSPPRPGDFSIVTTWAGHPLCVIETLSTEVLPFREVTAEFAATEGEGDGSLEHWRAGHEAYFTRECHRAGRTFSEEMLVVCERFKVVGHWHANNPA
jgi:uncharacterized protein YhfF